MKARIDKTSAKKIIKEICKWRKYRELPKEREDCSPPTVSIWVTLAKNGDVMQVRIRGNECDWDGKGIEPLILPVPHYLQTKEEYTQCIELAIQEYIHSDD